MGASSKPFDPSNYSRNYSQVRREAIYLKIALSSANHYVMTDKEKIQKLLSVTNRLLQVLGRDSSSVGKLMNNTKGGSKEFGYWHSECVLALDEVMRGLKCKSVIDLGCGMGLLMAQLQCLGEYRVGGIENEKSLVEKALVYPIIHKDLLLLNKGDIENYDCLYIWEPIKDEKLSKRFVTRLVKAMSPGQHIIYRCAGNTGAHIRNTEKFQQLKPRPLFEVYKFL